MGRTSDKPKALYLVEVSVRQSNMGRLSTFSNGKTAKLRLTQMLGHTMRAVIFIAFFALVFAFATLKSASGGLGLGTHSFRFYGWPQHWLTVDHRTQTTIVGADGSREGGEQSVERQIHWQSLAVSVAAAAGIAAILTVPFYFWPGRKPTKEHDHVA